MAARILLIFRALHVSLPSASAVGRWTDVDGKLTFKAREMSGR
jgi:hypothetical protein